MQIIRGSSLIVDNEDFYTSVFDLPCLYLDSLHPRMRFSRESALNILPVSQRLQLMLDQETDYRDAMVMYSVFVIPSYYYSGYDDVSIV
jgi:hypothetical protein